MGRKWLRNFFHHLASAVLSLPGYPSLQVQSLLRLALHCKKQAQKWDTENLRLKERKQKPAKFPRKHDRYTESRNREPKLGSRQLWGGNPSIFPGGTLFGPVQLPTRQLSSGCINQAAGSQLREGVGGAGGQILDLHA